MSRAPNLEQHVVEKEFKRKTCEFIWYCGTQLHLPVDAIASAHVFLHRFYAKQSFYEHDRLAIATACIFLATKVEECAKKMETVVLACCKAWYAMDIDTQHASFKRTLERVLIAERALLQTISFDLCVDNPHAHLAPLLKHFFNIRDSKLDRRHCSYRHALQVATNYCNDQLRSDLCLRYTGADIAAASVYLALLLLGNHQADPAMLNVDAEVLAGVSEEILDIYVSSEDG